MRSIIVLAILTAIGFIFLMNRKEVNTKKMLTSLLILAGIVTLGVIGNSMRSISALFLTHIVALIMAYFGLLYHIFKARLQWYLLMAPVATLLLYVALASIQDH